MFGRQDQSYLGTVAAARPPGRSRSRREQRIRERLDAEQITDLKWLWRSACGATSLSQFVYTPSGVTKAMPMITHVDLGPPVTLTVRIRPGQTAEDFTAAAPVLASALNVAALEVIPAGPRWLLRIVLQPEPGWSYGEALKFGA